MRKNYKTGLLFMLGAMGALGYFTWHGLHGSRGVERVATLNIEVKRLEKSLDELKLQRSRLEKQVVLLRPESIDPDMLDEEARLLLGFANENDRSIPLNADGSAASMGFN